MTIWMQPRTSREPSGATLYCRDDNGGRLGVQIAQSNWEGRCGTIYCVQGEPKKEQWWNKLYVLLHQSGSQPFIFHREVHH
jgi:hypothetical protein